MPNKFLNASQVKKKGGGGEVGWEGAECVVEEKIENQAPTWYI